MSDNKIAKQPNKSVQELTPAIKMSIEQVHAILGHSSKDATRRVAAALSMLITRGALKTCKSCAIAKARQKTSIIRVRKPRQTSSMVEFITTLQL
jgi:hypothetical protein